jgi:hypothetical protein
MASSLKYYHADIIQAQSALGAGMRRAGRAGMRAVMQQAQEDARAIDHWRSPGRYEEEYPSGLWSWEVTGMARSSIVGYVVPDKRLPQAAAFYTTSYHDGEPLQHPHSTDDDVTGDYREDPDTVTGILTMNVAYAPYLQDYEIRANGEPVVIEVLDANWSSVYVPTILVPAIDRALESVIRQYT